MTMDKKLVFLRGKRLDLRPPLRSDIPLWLRWLNDPEVAQFLLPFMPVLEAHEEKWYEDVVKDKNGLMVVMVTKDGTAIGNMGLHRIAWQDRTAWTGAVIGEKEYWGKGLGTEAKMLLLNYAFNTLNLRKVTAGHLAFNERSRDYQIKCGYREEGRLRNHHYRNGRYWDSVLMSVFKEDWLPLWEAYKKEHLG
jgi:RimJ/RimL family protein N-acetyltransferase